MENQKSHFSSFENLQIARTGTPSVFHRRTKRRKLGNFSKNVRECLPRRGFTSFQLTIIPSTYLNSFSRILFNFNFPAKGLIKFIYPDKFPNFKFKVSSRSGLGEPIHLEFPPVSDSCSFNLPLTLISANEFLRYRHLDVESERYDARSEQKDSLFMPKDVEARERFTARPRFSRCVTLS